MDDLLSRVDDLRSYLGIDDRLARLDELKARRLEPGFWDDNDRARETEQAIAAEKDWTDAFEALEGRGIGIFVGHADDPELAGRSTSADYVLDEIEEVESFLNELAR